MLQKEIKLESPNEIKDFSEYAENKLAIAKICVLSTSHNSHGLEISEEVLRRDIGSIRGNFLVADMIMGDASSHTASEVPVGYFLPNEEIEFEEVNTEEGKIVKAWAYAVLSKQYAKSAYEMFVNDNHRATSIEMTVLVDDEDENKVISFDAFGSTILGKTVAPSCKDAEISLIRFAKEAQSFADNQKKKELAEKDKYVSHPVNTSKDAIYEGEWDGQKAKEDLIKEKNYKSLAKKVCLKLEEGWENREITKLGYPVMGLYEGEWRYSAKGLASAQAYAEKENETEVLAKIKTIKKKLGLDNPDGKEETKMAEEIKEKVIETVTEKEKVEMTEPETTTNETETETKMEEEKATEEIVEEKEDFEAKCAQLTKDIEERDNIIMQKDAHIAECEKELAELREYKRCIEATQLSCKVEEALAEIKGFATDSQIDAFREEGKNCTFENIDAFINKIKATCFDATKSKIDSFNNSDMFRFSIPEQTKKSTSVWDRL